MERFIVQQIILWFFWRNISVLVRENRRWNFYQKFFVNTFMLQWLRNPLGSTPLALKKQLLICIFLDVFSKRRLPTVLRISMIMAGILLFISYAELEYVRLPRYHSYLNVDITLFKALILSFVWFCRAKNLGKNSKKGLNIACTYTY